MTVDEFLNGETDIQPVRQMAYGPVVNEFHSAAMFGPNKNPLGRTDVAASPDTGFEQGDLIMAPDGTLHTVADWSYLHPNQPTHNTIEFRDRPDQGRGFIKKVGGIDDFLGTKTPSGAGQEPQAQATQPVKSIDDFLGSPKAAPTPVVVPTPQEQSTLAAPQGSPEQQEISKAVAGNLAAPPGAFARQPTLAEKVQASIPQFAPDRQQIPMAPPLPEEKYQGVEPYLFGAAQAVIPQSWDQLREMVKPPMGGLDLERENQWGAAIRGELGPEEQASAITGTAMAVLPFAHLPFGEIKPVGITPGRTMADIEAAARAEPQITRPGMTTPPGTTADAVRQALERRFTMPETPPEAPPDLAPAPEITVPPERRFTMQPEPPPLLAAPRETLAESIARLKIPESHVSPETGQEFFQGEQPGGVPIPSETLRTPGTRSLALRIQEQAEPGVAKPEVPPPEAPPPSIEARFGPEPVPSTAIKTSPNGGTLAEKIRTPTLAQKIQQPVAAPEAAAKTVRLYHGGAGEQAGSDFTPDLRYAQAYADKTPGGKVWQVDVPEGSLKTHDEYGQPMTRVVVPDEVANRAKPLAKPAAAEPVAGTRPQPITAELPTEAAKPPVPAAVGAGVQSPQVTALKNAVTAAERETRGLSPREEVERRSWDQAKAISEREAASDPTRGARLVDELNQKPRALDDVEGAHLLRRKAEVNAEHDAAVRQMNADPEDVNAMARLKVAREELQKTYNAAEVSGTAWGRGGRIRQALMAEDFSPQAMEAKARAIGNKGQPLEDSQLRKVAEHHDKIAKQEASIRLTENDLQRPAGGMQPREILAEVEKMKQRLAPCL